MQDKFAELWESLDREKITAAIGSLSLDFDTDAARECVFYAAHRWLLRDLESLSVESVEQTIIEPEFKYILDIAATFNGAGSVKVQEGRSFRPRNFSSFAGKKVIIDWKTSKNALDAEWIKRYVDSWQWREYLTRQNADIFIYRGIRRRNDVNGDLETKEVIIHASEDPNLQEATRRHNRLLKAQRDNLIQLGEVPWPMNRPTACHKYGYDCPYINDCWSGNVDRRVLDPAHPFSYSREEEFMLCPERFRRNALNSRDVRDGIEDQSDAASFGNAVHRGLAEVYRQAFNLQGTE